MSHNPDDIRVVRHRHSQIAKSRTRPHETLREFLHASLLGRNVIDFGYANHSLDTTHIATTSTHAMVVEFARRVVAIDVIEGSHLHLGACTYLTGNFLEDPQRLLDSLTERPDLFFGGSCLEHLSDPSSLFRLADDILEVGENSRLILVVPNLIWLPALRDIMLAGLVTPVSLNVDHISTFDPSGLTELGERHGFELLTWSFVGRSDMVPVWGSRSRWDLWGRLYWLSRKLRLPTSYNLLAVTFRRMN